MNDKQKNITYILVALSMILALVGAYFGVKLPYPEPPSVDVPSGAAAGSMPPTNIRELRVTHDAAIGGDLTVTGSSTIGSVAFGSSQVFEGATADAYETTFAITDPTADRTITFPNSSGTVALNPYGESIEFEGASADAYETTLAVTDPTADVTATLPVASGTIMLSSLATNAPDAANSVTGASNALLFEGATANAYEMSVSPADPGADVTLTLPAETAAVMVSSLTTNATDAANSVTGASNALVFEGSGVDAYETSLIATNPGADKTITLPAVTGTVGLIAGTGMDTVIYGSSVVTGTATITHGLTTPLAAFCAMGTDPVDNEEDRCTVTISGATVTAKVWKEAASPTAGDSGVTVYWSVAGTK